MVMKRNAMGKNLRQSIRKSFGRYIAIAAIIALGSAVFVGLLMTKRDMVATGQSFTDAQNMYDLRMVGSYGWTEDSVEAVSRLPGVTAAEGGISVDLIATPDGSGEDAVYRFYAVPDTVNLLALRDGRMPQRPDECLADGFYAKKYPLGSRITLSDDNAEDDLDNMKVRSFVVVGHVASPLYMDMNRGTSSVGSGSLDNYFYVLKDAFDLDYYTDIYVTIPGENAIYTDAYNDLLDQKADELKPELEAINLQRYEKLRQEAEEEYTDGYREYLDGLKDYEDGKAEAEQELAEAEAELKDGEEELRKGKITLLTAEDRIREGRQKLEEAKQEYKRGRAQFNEQKAAAEPQIAAAQAQLDSNKAMLQPGYDQAAAAKPGLETAIAGLNAQLESLDPEDPEQAGTIAAVREQLGAYQAQLSAAESAISAMAAVEAGYAQLESQRQQLAAAEAQLDQADAVIRQNDRELDQAASDVTSGWNKWHDSEQELADGWQEYYDAKAEAEQELADAEAELKDAEAELADARQTIDDMEAPELYLLDRNSNVGFVNLNSNSDIVAGVSRVFPVFFLLVASLVCITTMTRMIDEERTQIGTLKALGYSNAAIISKYMIYSGSSALLGCVLGIWAGCTVFPQIIWQAYCIMIYIQPTVVLTVDWPLFILVVSAYLAVMLAVTWYCCHKTLEEEPAELIRPKAPEAGKKVLLEYLPFWDRISFLNKVTIRNVFRYRQRLAMMLVGIGGCTALLVTGFGLRDSIVNIMFYQFDSVMHYDMSVYFREENTSEEKQDFLKAVGAGESLFYHQSSVELDAHERVKEVYLLSAGGALTDYVSLASDGEPVPMPGIGETVLSVGVAENLGIHTGDRILIRNSDLETLELKVSGIFDNHVYNYALVLPETIEDQWGRAPEEQMAFVRMEPGQDVYACTAAISGLDNVMTVSVSEDVANMVRNMMDALDLVVVLIIFCAGLLAVTVLYNLTNININERIREIATIKVLGFNASETGAYVFKENMVLTCGGIVLGMGMGKLLLIFVMSQVKIDMVWFKAIAELPSYLWSATLTLLSAVAVNILFFFRLDKINMAEALKSVE